MHWQKIKRTPHYGNLYRAEVPGGWLVLADTWAKDESGHYAATGVSICFYPDPLRKWTIEEETPEAKKPGAE